MDDSRRAPEDPRGATVPLTQTALALLEVTKVEISRLSVRRNWEAEDAVFAARRSGALTVRALSKVMDRCYREKLGAKGDGWTPHDLRRTCRARMAATGVPDEIAERVIGHAPKGIIGVYNLHRYDAEKQAALEAWERALLAIVSGEPAEAKVTPIGRGRKS